jgi:hypothetical protein
MMKDKLRQEASKVHYVLERVTSANTRDQVSKSGLSYLYVATWIASESFRETNGH